MSKRQTHHFRLDEAAIQRWTRTLLAVMGVLVGTGLGLGAWSDRESAPTWLGEVAYAVVGLGVIGPLLVAAVVGGESIRRGGGIAGGLLTYGIVAGACGEAFDVRWAFWSGGVAFGLAIVAFWVMGWIAGVPMFIGLPWARGRTVQRAEPGGPGAAPDDRRLRPKPPRGARATRGPRR